MIRKTLTTMFMAASVTAVMAQSNGLVDMQQSNYAKMSNMPLGSTSWTGGFWGERFQKFSEVSIWSMWDTWKNPDISHGFRNFEIAAGEIKGTHWGPPFHDGDMYKWLEGCAAVYAITKNPKLDALMDQFIERVVKSQRADGYIHTPVIIDELNKGIDTHSNTNNTVIGTAVGGKDEKGAFANRLNFETYNLGHLMMAGITHKRATGKTTLFDAAVKATDFLCHFYETASAELARNAICPSHYMGVVEMYRATGNKRYLELSKNLINIRGLVENGTDDNQDRIPFREQYNAMGHAVRANYLYAGVADVFAETGEQQLMDNLTSIWMDIVTRKMYITGACGSLYDGTSPDGTNYTPDSIQKVHQSYGRAYQLPQSTAHNETCANIGNMLFNWRMLQTTGQAKYADIVEMALYNSVLSGISLDGEKYFYTNPLRMSKDFPYTLRWPKTREKYISCFCCPPNTLRTVCEAQNYAYSIGGDTLWVNLYGHNHLHTNDIDIEQTTEYPYDGKITLKINKAKGISHIMVRVPEWASDGFTASLNGQLVCGDGKPNTYVAIKKQEPTNKKQKSLDKKFGFNGEIEVNINMRPHLVEANPLVEEARNQVAVKYGPIVYCLESIDIEGGKNIDDVVIPTDIKFTTTDITIDGHRMKMLQGTAMLCEQASWKDTLYRQVQSKNEKVNISLIPYYAWGNRNKCDMTVWMPLGR